MRMVPHIKLGRFYGAFYYMDDGRAVYLAHRKRTEIYYAKNAWCIDLKTLEECKERGISYVGVVTKSASDTFYYLTPLDDMWGVHSFAHFGDTRQRGLPVTKFRMNPAITPAVIAKAVRVR